MKQIDLQALQHQLAEEGYAVIENVLNAAQLEQARERVANLMAAERADPFPLDDERHEDDDDILAYYKRHYTVSDMEARRMVARVHQYRRDNENTRWPVPINKVSKNFLHLPTLFDDDKSQRVWNLLNKAPDMIPLIEHPVVLPMVRSVMGQDCNLHDFQATSIGPGTGGGAWHVDAPLGQIAEPLPEFPLTLQNVWMLDDFTADNGATRVMPRSHKLRKSPPWGSGPLDGEVTLTAPAGSVAIWLSNTWHRSGPNHTGRERRAILCNYNVSWLRGFADFTSTLPAGVAATLSNEARYLLGYGARAPLTR
ncbi:phytanoyl-CoA dioxygenase family protein [Achromobacter pestifer]|uniref:Phytanoyl-CoA dioxygenase family protein n=1 Tax=Achromobacter pestifer TaxID=1353889 RepID=A0A7D4HPI1_9BURK|nr:phytanoyl-CoA dioxygenase family protein [Achromobacter pestifer]QKH34499.1 phytanoyl-CoA dioxygenase family protein [Achromobacter pestifer]